jgi:hypothetical protein
MNAPLDLLSQAIMRVRPHLDRSVPVRDRIRIFWCGVVAARKLGASDVVTEEFTELARSSGLAADMARHGGDEGIAHVIRWGLLNRDPFGGMS